MATASAKKKTAAMAPRMTIEPAEGGVTSQVHEPFGMSKGTSPFGQQPPAPSWGSMLNSAQRFLTQAPWLAVFPGLAIFMVATVVFAVWLHLTKPKDDIRF